MRLDVLIPEERFIVSPDRRDAPLFLPPLVFGMTPPIELHAWNKDNSGDLVAVDLADYQISLLVGPSNVRPTLGFWQLTTTAGTSLPIASRASSNEVAMALMGGAFPANTTVTGGNGSYIVTLSSGGIWALPTATFQGNTLSSVLVFQISPGTAQTPAQYRIEVLEVAPARIVPANWTTGDTSPVNTFTQVDGRLWSLVLSPLVDNGFFTLTVDGDTTEFIAFNDGFYAIEIALAAIGKNANVIPNGTGGFWVRFDADVTTASVEGNLVILPFATGNLALTSTGIRELLDGVQFTGVKLTVILVRGGTTEMAACADIMLQMPVNQPATIVIDAPMMAGLTFAISEDESYLLVYQNGTLIGECALSAAV